MNTKEKVEEFEKTISNIEKMEIGSFLFDTPLYKKKRVSYSNDVRRLFSVGATKIDGYCYQCKRDSVFHSVNDEEDTKEPTHMNYYNGFQNLVFQCQRNDNHTLYFSVLMELKSYYSSTVNRGMVEIITGTLMKIGQFPSHSDIANGDLKKFNKVLNGIDRAEFIRANGLAASGVNIGAFVYLRRLFERLITRAKDRAGDAIDSKKFSKSRVDEKIELLKDYLPDFMVKNGRVYGLLSKGIHELDEETCGKLYELLRQSSLLMLEQEKDLKEQLDLEADISNAISNLDLTSLK